ncbi:MAG: DUF4270 family protein [Ferruginibacter sp.]
MFKRLLPITIFGYLSIVVFNWGCTKLDTTNLGADLIPAVDNVNTFSTTLDIITTQGRFDDSFKIARSENHLLGIINGDFLFGQSKANIYLQPKPSFYPYYFGNAGDTLVMVDSVVLTLSYKGSWGDTSQLQTLNVYEFYDTNFGDSVFKFKTIKYQPPMLGNLLATKSIDIRRLRDTVRFANGKDSSTNQIRIKLSDAFAQTLGGRDSTRAGIGNNNAFFKDSIYRKLYSGLAVVPSGASGNALMYINISETKTRLEIHYKKKANQTGKLDTTFTTFNLQTNDFATLIPSGTANNIQRAWSGNVLNPSTDALYLQTSPGTFVNLRIPALDTFRNAIIHRAQISIEQIPDNPMVDSIFSVPPYIYLDIIDTGVTKWKPLYFDLNPNVRYDPDYKSGFPYFPTGDIDYTYFGGFARKKTNAIGESVYYYDLNVTRYVQYVVKKDFPNYQLRLFPGSRVLYPQFSTASFIASDLPLDNPMGFGRIKVKSGAHPDNRVKMRMVIIWSKI